MATEGERLAILETKLDGIVSDLAELSTEGGRTRRRLHNLEGFAQAYLDTQKVHRRQEESQYRRLGNAIGLAGITLSFGMLVLAAVTLIVHG